jgi:hypothetical protein
MGTFFTVRGEVGKRSAVVTNMRDFEVARALHAVSSLWAKIKLRCD